MLLYRCMLVSIARYFASTSGQVWSCLTERILSQANRRAGPKMDLPLVGMVQGDRSSLGEAFGLDLDAGEYEQ